MGYPTVEKACLVFDLKTGTLILGVLNLIVSIVGTIACLALLVGYTANSDKVVEVVVEQHPELVPQEVDNGDLSEAVGIGKYFFSLAWER